MGHPAEKDADHPTLVDEVGDSYEQALEAEKAGYLERGLPDRAAQVDDELTRVRCGAPVPVEVETADEAAPVEQAVPAKAKRTRKS